MKRNFSLAMLGAACLVLLLTTVIAANAQNREKFVISAHAGGMNAISGRAERKSYQGGDWSLLSITDDLKAGDIVRTANDGRVEMLLNPGSYFRVGESSEFQLTDNSLENLEVRLVRGTAIIEATGADETELAINITTPHARMVIVKRGLYRVNVIPGDITELFVRKGRVMLADSHTKVKEGNKVIFSATTFSVAKMEKKDKTGDMIEAWSKDRAQTVALANNKIRNKDLDVMLSGLQDYWWASIFPRSSGLWLFNPYYSCYTFLPFSYGWGSPYGRPYIRTFACAVCGGYGPDLYRPGFIYERRSGGYVTGNGAGQHPGPVSGPTGPTSGSGGMSPVNPGLRGGQTGNGDWPGRSVGKPDINPDPGRGRPVPPRDNR
jgi:hypothetical protein